MSILWDVLLWGTAAVVLVPVAVLLAETWAALLGGMRKGPAASVKRPRCAVLVPAHDEEGGVARTIQALTPQLGPFDRVVVVADNCSDRTAAAAQAAGATVVERHDAGRRGKGFALDHGVRFLEQDPPDVVVVVDADCLVDEGALTRLVNEAAATGRPVQAAYLMAPPVGAGYRERASAFAFQYKNLVRPLGLWRLGLPCLLTGTGMAFPWALLRGATLAHGNIVEDMQLGLDLAAAGSPPRFCPEARVRSEFPSGRKAAAGQRTRWEHGHLQTLLRQAPRLAAAALLRKRLDLLGLALELSVPPLSMLFLLGAAVLAALAGAWLAGGSALPALVLFAAGCTLFVSILAAQARFGGAGLRPWSLLAAPLYALAKAPLYLAFFIRPQREWIRTEREPSRGAGFEQSGPPPERV
jgi:cellulose synthase/poly-beta-1,6-N-acetylglucosamine synthase-like glycosyltransferase